MPVHFFTSLPCNSSTARPDTHLHLQLALGALHAALSLHYLWTHLTRLEESRESLSLERSKGLIWVFAAPKTSLNSHRVEHTVMKEFLATLHVKLEQVLSIKKILNPAHIYFGSSPSGHKATVSVSSFPGLLERVKDNLFFLFFPHKKMWKQILTSALEEG